MPTSKRPQWKERLIASTSASTLKIAGVGKKLRNKIILLRNVFIPPCVKPPPSGAESPSTTPRPEKFQSLDPSVKHEAVTQRIICIREQTSLFDGCPEASADEKDEARTFGCRRKPLSTLQEVDDEMEEEMYVEALVLPMEKLDDIPAIAKSFGDPDRSRVSPPFMHKQLASDESGTLSSLGANPISRNIHGDIHLPLSTSSTMYDDRRPSYASEDRRTSGASRHIQPSVKSPVAISFISEQSRDRGVSLLSASSFGFNAGGDAIRSSKRPVSANLSLCGSEASTAEGRRRSAVFMMPKGSTGRKRQCGASGASAEGKENVSVQRQGPGNSRMVPGRQHQGQTIYVDIEDGGDDDDDEGETQSYYVFETTIEGDSEHGGRDSMLVLMPIPEGEQPKDRSELEGRANAITSRWSVTDDITSRSSLFSTAPSAPSPPPPKTTSATRHPHRSLLAAAHEAIQEPLPIRPPVPSKAQDSAEPVPVRSKPAAVPTRMPSPSLSLKTLSAPPPKKSTGLGGSIPLPPPPLPRGVASGGSPKRSKSALASWSRATPPAASPLARSISASMPPRSEVTNRRPSTRARMPAVPTSSPKSPKHGTLVRSKSHPRATEYDLHPPPYIVPVNRSPPQNPAQPTREKSRRSSHKEVKEDKEMVARVAQKTDEFLLSSGRAFQGQKFSAIQVLDGYSGEMEVHVGRGAKPPRNEAVRSSSSAPSMPSPAYPLSRGSTVRQRPSM